ncbi:MAG: energy transducer TonB [Xanthomonadaceae bacterium]|jgi:protein TonB|nr:energy transducer TonB [Xanthomonadaceae bacterium]
MKSLPYHISVVLPVAILALSGCGKSSSQPEVAAIPPTEVMAVDTPKPDYPLTEACAGNGGEVLLSVVVGPEGRPASVSLLRSSGFPALDQAALDKIPAWEFRAATRNGQPIPQTIQVPVNYTPPEIRPDECFKLDENSTTDN